MAVQHKAIIQYKGIYNLQRLVACISEQSGATANEYLCMIKGVSKPSSQALNMTESLTRSLYLVACNYACDNSATEKMYVSYSIFIVTITIYYRVGPSE